MRVLLATLLLCCAPTAGAQLGLPPVRLPAVNVPGVLPGITDPATAPLDTGQLRELRHLRVRELLRRHRDMLEADPHGELIVRGEVLALAPDAAALEAATGAGFTIAREQSFPELGTRLVVLHVTGDTARALQRLQALDAAGSYDFNHVYLDSGALPGAQRSAADAAGDTNRPEANPGAPGAVARIGLIDSGVDAGHGAFHGLALHQHGCAGAVIPAAHGTAVASLLVGRTGGFHGAAPGSELYAADVFCGLPTGGSVDAVAAAFAWLVAERVPVINVSLVGPANRTLERIVLNVVARGYLVVAAVGNDGPGRAAFVSGGLAWCHRRHGGRHPGAGVARGRARPAGKVRRARRRHGGGQAAAWVRPGPRHILRRADRRGAPGTRAAGGGRGRGAAGDPGSRNASPAPRVGGHRSGLRLRGGGRGSAPTGDPGEPWHGLS